MGNFRFSVRQQLILIILISLLILGLYGWKRLVPKVEALNATSQALEKDKLHVEMPMYPELPADDPELLKEKSDTLETKLSLLNAQLSSLESSLAPVDTQDALLKISEVARTSGVKVIESVPYLVQKRLKNDETAKGKKTKKAKTKNEKRRERNAKKRARKKAKRLGANTAAVGVATREGELMDRLVNDLDESRLLQRISVQGSFAHTQQFIQSIQALPWQITIVKLDMNINPQTPPQGLPQPLTAKMIIAM